MISVARQEGEGFDSLLRRFRQAVQRGRVLSEVKRRRFFVSRSEEQRRAKRRAVSRQRKLAYR